MCCLFAALRTRPRLCQVDRARAVFFELAHLRLALFQLAFPRLLVRQRVFGTLQLMCRLLAPLLLHCALSLALLRLLAVTRRARRHVFDLCRTLRLFKLCAVALDRAALLLMVGERFSRLFPTRQNFRRTDALLLGTLRRFLLFLQCRRLLFEDGERLFLLLAHRPVRVERICRTAREERPFLRLDVRSSRFHRLSAAFEEFLQSAVALRLEEHREERLSLVHLRRQKVAERALRQEDDLTELGRAEAQKLRHLLRHR